MPIVIPAQAAAQTTALLVALLAPTAVRTPALRELLAAQQCEVVDRLARIHATPNPADQQNRYLILSRADAPQDYVQCAFDQLDRHMLCEAASGYFYDVPRTMHLKPAAIAMLGLLGFSTDDDAPQNFRRSFPVADPPNLDAIAKLMLAALFVGYDVRADTALRFDAPDAPRPSGRCGTAMRDADHGA